MSVTNISEATVEDDGLDVEDLHSSTAKIATIVYLAIMAIIGTVGNLLVILTVVKVTRFHRLTYILIANLSIVGLLVCLIIIPSHIVNIFKVGHVNSDAILCDIEGYFNFMLTIAMITNSNAIALNRYLVVNKQQTNHQPKQNTTIIILLLWVIPIALAFSAIPFTGYHDYILDCFFLISDKAYWYVVCTISIPGIITIGLICACYSLILRKVRRSRLRVTALLMKRNKTASEATSTCSDIPSDIPSDIESEVPQPSTSSTCCAEKITDVRKTIETVSIKKNQYRVTSKGKSKKQTLQVSVTNTSRMLTPFYRSQSQIVMNIESKAKNDRLAKVKFKQEVRLTLQLFMVFSIFCCLYMPICVAHILHPLVPISPDLWLTLFTLSLSFSTTTWILYGVLNKDFREAYAKIIFCKK